MPTSKYRKPRSLKPAHRPAKTIDNATETIHIAPIPPSPPAQCHT